MSPSVFSEGFEMKDTVGPVTHIANSRGYTISYQDFGSGPPIMVVPGFFQSAADYREAGYAARLSSTHRVLLVDPLGHGQSDKPHDEAAYCPRDVAADLVAVLDAAGIKRAVLWGYSRGAWLAAIAAAEFPERVSALLLGGADLPKSPSRESPPWLAPLSRGEWAKFWAAFGIPLDDAIKHHFERNDARAMAAVVQGSMKDYDLDLHRISAPALMYKGANDPLQVAETAIAWGKEMHVVQGADHFGAFKSLDAVLPFITTFLKAH